MRKLNRILLLAYSFVVALLSLLLLLPFLNKNWGSSYVAYINSIAENTMQKAISIIALAVVFLLAIATMVYAIMSSRMSRSRITTNDIGDIDIGVDAIQNIALNAAKSAQVGVKTAKARATKGKAQTLSITMVVQLYSDVEIPTQMAKIQDRVKKDVERYTGIPVSEVKVKVSRVELVGAKIER